MVQQSSKGKGWMQTAFLPLIIIAVVLGAMTGRMFSEPWVRLFVTFDRFFTALLNLLIPLIIIGYVTPAISRVGRNAGMLLGLTVLFSFIDTMLSGFLAYSTGDALFPSLTDTFTGADYVRVIEVKPYFDIQIASFVDVMSALILSFVFGISAAYYKLPTLKTFFDEMRQVADGVIRKIIIPLLPLYVFGIVLNMSFSGETQQIVSIFAKVIGVILVLHVVVLLYEYLIAGIVTRRNPLMLLWRMMPAYVTAFASSSSAATIPVTLRQTLKNGVSDEVAGFTVPLCATIHMAGSMMKITCSALTICMISGMPYDFSTFIHFMLILAMCMLAAPGVPGGAIMAALSPLASVLGFDEVQQSMMIALYIAMDSFGTACNVTGDGAIAIIVDRLFRKSEERK